MFYGFVITEAGNALLASMVAGQTLTITGVTMDKGTAESAEAARQLDRPHRPGAGRDQHRADGGRERRQHDCGVSVRPERRPAGRVLDRRIFHFWQGGATERKP